MRLPASRRVRLAVLFGWVAAVVLASVIDPPSSALGAAGPFGLGADKWIHLGTYWTTALLAAAALRARDLGRLALAACVAFFLGGGLELLQATLPARSFGVGDLAANAAGAVLGSATYAAVAAIDEGTDDDRSESDDQSGTDDRNETDGQSGTGDRNGTDDRNETDGTRRF